MKVFILFFFALSLFAAAETMTLANKHGKVIEAELIDVDDKKRITFKRKDGRTFKLPFSDFAGESLVAISREWTKISEQRANEEYKATAPHWKIAYFIFPSIDAKVSKRHIKSTMTPDRLKQFTDKGKNMGRVMEDWSGKNARIHVETIVIEEALTRLSPIRGSYWPSPNDVQDLIGKTVREGKYDSVVIAIDSGSFRPNYAGLGMTNMPDGNPLKATYALTTNPHAETFIHEWLHGSSTYARNALRIDCPDPHENGKLGVGKQNGGWEHWYRMLMTGTAPRNGEPKAGFTAESWLKGGPYYKRRRPKKQKSN